MAEDFNQQVIERFRANGGKVDGFPDLLLLTVAGRRTGRPRTTPLAYREDAGRYLVFGSNGGAPQHPLWYRNLLAAGGGTAELPDGAGGTVAHSVRPVELDPDERARQYAEQARRVPAFAEYADRADRAIPVIALHPLDLSGDPALPAAIVAGLRLHHEDLRRQLADLRARLDGAAVPPGADFRTAGPVAGLGPVAGPDLAAQLRARCLSFCHGLDMHHIREEGAFTAFQRQYPQLGPAIARLRADHRTVADALARFEAHLATPAAADPAALRTELDRLTEGLEAHFAYEEERLLAVSAPHPER
ncbi:nitroreductase/quinone reductase family protein [Kitasatospora sp. YST-16]|uniref:nitroreductase/quinone reductase family protein n=1 Tax=Kitasatospora sp. YST-16 TaxID=2998080 RepID=UPI0022852A6B|nr:nitroreductase/quinone reductase family protein [Kitasatospora sp. YST-16]WAL75892.1 nitroreductase/quinone reductase family protein [Kitasatospora sp. YST-16]WNW41953.1 nitroreductase/quinone reductase family protein [Streptomyces sp. Li-HN-5-13]